MTFNQLVIATQERERFKKMNHPYIQVIGDQLYIDAWCDGNEHEVQKVLSITKKYRNATT